MFGDVDSKLCRCSGLARIPGASFHQCAGLLFSKGHVWKNLLDPWHRVQPDQDPTVSAGLPHSTAWWKPFLYPVPPSLFFSSCFPRPPPEQPHGTQVLLSRTVSGEPGLPQDREGCGMRGGGEWVQGFRWRKEGRDVLSSYGVSGTTTHANSWSSRTARRPNLTSTFYRGGSAGSGSGDIPVSEGCPVSQHPGQVVQATRGRVGLELRKTGQKALGL